jgi:hypothetical protein
VRPTLQTRCVWIFDRPRIERLAKLVARADALMFAQHNMRRAFLSNVRFDQRDADVTEGLAPGALELSALERLTLRTIQKLPDRLFDLPGATAAFALHTRRLMSSASGACIVLANDDSPATDLLVGRTMQRAWLKLAEKGLAAQPMMSLLVLANACKYSAQTFPAKVIRTSLSLLDGLQELTNAPQGMRPAFLLRFGYAPPPTARSGRPPVSTVLTALETPQLELAGELQR